MISLAPLPSDPRPLRVLCLGAHADDIEIGCGGTILELMSGSRPVSVRWVVFSGDERRAREAQASAQQFLTHAVDQTIDIHAFPDGVFPHVSRSIKSVFEQIKCDTHPDVIFTHALNDSHQDHATIATLTHNTFRDHMILGYEIPKYDGDLGRANAYIHISEDAVRNKAEKICEYFPSQNGRTWFNPTTFMSLAHLRGIECNAPQGFAEAFYSKKFVLAL